MRSILRTLLISVLAIVVGLAIVIALSIVVGYFWGTGRGVITFIVATGLMAGFFAAKSKGETGHY